MAREPRHNGRPLTEYLKQIRYAENAEQAKQAVQSIRTMGSKALPALLQKTTPANRFLRSLWTLADERRELRHFRFEYPRGNDLRLAALFALQQLGPEAASLAPRLVHCLSSRDIVTLYYARSALEMIGPSACPQVEALCADADPWTRVQAVYTLYTIQFGRTEWTFRSEREPCRSLNMMGRIPDESTFVHLLKHPNPAVRRATADWFALHASMRRAEAPGIHYPAQVSLMIEALSDGDAKVRQSAQQALKAMDPESASSRGIQ